MNKTLQAQVSRHLSEGSLNEECLSLLNIISNDYDSFESTSIELNHLFETIPDVFFSVDIQAYRLLQITQSCRDVYGYEAQSFYENPNLWYQLILEEDRPVIDANYSLMNAGKHFVHEYRIRHGDGSIRWLKSRLTPVMNDGKVVKLYGITSDITQRKEAQIALANNEKKFRTLIKNSADVNMLISEAYDIVFVSDSIYQLSGYKPEEVIGKKSLDFVHPDDIKRMEEYSKKVRTQPGVMQSVTYKRIQKNGSTIWCEGTAVNMLDDPSVNGIVVNFRDVTERVKESMAVEEMTKALIKRNNLLEKFANMVSHDLRGALTRVFGIIHLFRDVSLTEEERNLIMNDLYDEASDMDKVIHHLNEILEVKDS